MEESKTNVPETNNCRDSKQKRFKNGGKGNFKHAPYNMASAVDNAIEYYNKYPTDYNAAFNMPWFQIMGTPINFHSMLNPVQGLTGSPGTIKIPSIMGITYVPGPGICQTAQDPANRTFAMLMSDLYAKTSGASLGFDNAQIAMQLTSLASIANALGEASRALSCTELYKSRNANYPRALISALGFKYTDLVKNKAIYVTRLNSLVHMFNNLQVPAFMDIYKRQYSLASNIYVDEDDDYGQMYVFKEMGMYIYDFEAGRCRFSVRHDVGEFSLFLDDIQDALFRWVNSSDFYKVNGALLRAYKDAPAMTIPDTQLDDVIVPAKPDHILTQIMNMDIVDVDTNTLDIQQDVARNVIYWQPCLYAQAESVSIPDYQGGFRKHLVRLFNADPGVDDNCEATRLQVTLGPVKLHDVDLEAGTDKTSNRYGITSMQSEIVTRVSIYQVTDDYESVNLAGQLKSNVYTFNVSTDMVSPNLTPDLVYAMRAMFALQPFRYIPTIFTAYNYIDNKDESNSWYSGYHFLGDVYNYTLLDEKVLSNMNSVALLSMWRPTI